MIKLLARLFIKDNKNYNDSNVRIKYGILCNSFGIFLNLFLFAAKMTGSLLSKSIAMTADAINNLSDAASSFIGLLGFKLSGKKPDKDHPFGHGRIEYISGLIVSFLILFMGLELLKSSITNIIHPEKINGGLIPLCIMILGIAVKLYMFIYNHSIAKKIKSTAMEAIAKDSLSDMISTTVVIISIIISRWTDLPVDGIGGLIVAFFIIKEGFESCKETIDPLLGLPPEKEFVEEIEQETLKYKPICGIHDLVVHDYGPGRLMISLHAEVPGHLDIFDLHEVIDRAEYELSRKFNCSTVIHMDPIDTQNERLASLKELAIKVCKEIDERISVHDVRMVPGEKNTNLIFDVVRPHDCKLNEDELKLKIFMTIREIEKDITCVITVDAPYVR